MVQFIFTPWRNRTELLTVRDQFYHDQTSSSHAAVTSTGSVSGRKRKHDEANDATEVHALQERQDLRRKAIARAFMWVHRGNCPHVVESTALLAAAIVQDEQTSRHGSAARGAVEEYVVRAAYLTAFTRFVTGLLDGYQDKAHKLSMYGIAKSIGLPAAFVELRHQGTHEPLPSLAQLRPAAKLALEWIWDYFWKDLEPEDLETEGELITEDGETVEQRQCRVAVIKHLREQDVMDEETAGLPSELEQFGTALVQPALMMMIQDAAADSRILLRALKLLRRVIGQAAKPASDNTVPQHHDIDIVVEEITALRREVASLAGFCDDPDIKKTSETADVVGWSKLTDQWTPRAVGIV